jgi:two-component system sensor histidine kinase RegB
VDIVSDRALEQVLVNLLENAREAAPESALTLRAWCDGGQQAQEGDEFDADELVLHLQVLDRGPGFDAATLAHFGNPYQSSKGQPGRGLGLFLSVNVARSLGGRLEARNREGGGAAVTLSLPLSSLLPRKSA